MPPQESAPSERWSGADVEAYLARFQVEEAVQQAVNSAIRHKAADPVLHVADFLEARGTEMEAALNPLPAAPPAPARPSPP